MGSKKDRKPTASERTVPIPGVDMGAQVVEPLHVGSVVNRVAEHWDNSDDLARCDHYAQDGAENALCGAMVDRREKRHLTEGVCQKCHVLASAMMAVVR